MKCHICSAENPDYASYCEQCGTNLQQPVHAAAPVASIPVEQPRITEPSPLPADQEDVKADVQIEQPQFTDYSSPSESILPQPHLVLPTQTPRILQRQESFIPQRAAWVGITIGIVVSLLISGLADPKGQIGHIFDLTKFSGVIPVAICAMFFWGLVILWLRWRHLEALESLSGQELLQQTNTLLGSTRNLKVVADELKNPVCEASPLLQRLQAVVQQWLRHASFNDADLLLQQHMIKDEQAVHAGYSLVRTFVWALPVLGLIGTVLGIAEAVGGFSEFLGGNIEDVKVIKQNLVGVTGGLSFAFLITLGGLFTSLVIMLPAASLQNREEKLYTTVQQRIIDLFLPKLQEVAPESKSLEPIAPGSDELLKSWCETLEKIATEVVNTVGSVGKRLLENLEDWKGRQHQQFVDELETLGKTVERISSAAVAIIGEETSKWRQDWHQDTLNATMKMGGTLGSAGEKLALASRELLAPISEARKTLREQQTVLQNQMQTMLQQVTEQTKALQLATETVSALTGTTGKALQQQATLQQAVQQLREANVEGTFGNLVEALAAQTRDMQASTKVVAQLATLTEQLQESQKKLQQAISQLHETGLEKTLSDFRDSLKSLGLVLEGFQKPFVLRAVPVKEIHEVA